MRNPTNGLATIILLTRVWIVIGTWYIMWYHDISRFDNYRTLRAQSIRLLPHTLVESGGYRGDILRSQLVIFTRHTVTWYTVEIPGREILSVGLSHVTAALLTSVCYFLRIYLSCNNSFCARKQLLLYIYLWKKRIKQTSLPQYPGGQDYRDCETTILKCPSMRFFETSFILSIFF
jgi:hypothetical protein